MRMMCPHCYADEGWCREALPECKATGEQRRAMWASASGFEPAEPTGNRAALRAEVKRLRRKVATLRAQKGRAR